MKLTPTTGDPLFVLLYNVKTADGVCEEYYAYFSSEEQALEQWSNSFEGNAEITLIGIAKMVSYAKEET